MKHGFIGSDPHCGHRVGLTPPSYNHIPPEEAEHQLNKQYNQRKILWEWFDAELQKCKKFDWALLNGDLIEGENAKAGGVELIHPSRKDQVAMAIKVVETINAKRYDFTYGTPYHSGNREDFEDLVAEAFGAEIHNEGHFDIEGLIVVAKHFIGNSSSPISRATAITSAMIKQMLWAELGQQPKANLIVRSHIHRCFSVSDPPLNKAGWITPALQGLGSRYGMRQFDGLPVTFGFLELFVESLDRWGVVAHICPLSYQKATVVKI